MIDLRYLTIQIKLPKFIRKDLEKYVQESNIYHPQPESLINTISKKYSLSKKRIFLTAGSDEAIMAIKNTYCRLVVYFTPTYSEYDRKLSRLDRTLEVNSLSGNKYEIIPKKFPRRSLIFIANPNNPFGITPRERIITLINLNPKSIIVVDEAYSAFNNVSVIRDADKFNNLIILRSFSKDYALAGIRIGFMTAPQMIINEVKEKIQTANTSYLSIGAAISAMNHEYFFKKQVNRIIKTKQRFCKFLDRLGYEYINSSINAVTIKFISEEKANKFQRYLQKNEVFVYLGNGSSNLGLDNRYIRITISNYKVMSNIMNLIQKYK